MILNVNFFFLNWETGFPLCLVIKQNPVSQVIELNVKEGVNKDLIDFVDKERCGWGKI